MNTEDRRRLATMEAKARMADAVARYRPDAAEWARARAQELRTAARRERNAILRELCGTSARAARADMGL